MGNFSFSHHGWFEPDYIFKGVFSSLTTCACACNEDTKCAAFSFRHDKQRCYFLHELTNSTEKVHDCSSDAYIKNELGNDFLLMFKWLRNNFSILIDFSPNIIF